MSTNEELNQSEISLAKPIAPEDVRPRMYVALLHEVGRPSCCWCDWEDEWWRERRRRVELSLPWDVEPQHVKAVCLPFVLAESMKGEVETIDTRRYRLALLPERYGRIAFAKLRKEQAKEKTDEKKSDAVKTE